MAAEPDRMKADRTESWVALAAQPGGVPPFPRPNIPAEAWTSVYRFCVAPVVELIRATHPRVVAISGSPGAGKSTVSEAIAAQLARSGVRAASLSLDDFYLSRQQRARLGIKWRAAPGSHDIELMVATLAAVQSEVRPLTLPRFNASLDDRGSDEILMDTPAVVVFDGWFLGYAEAGYERALPYIDWHLHLDVPPSVARSRRFLREEILRGETGRGFTSAQMEEFWSEVMGPGISTWVDAASHNADVIIRMTGSEFRCLVDRRLDEFLSARSG
jgi:uridine kinase